MAYWRYAAHRTPAGYVRPQHRRQWWDAAKKTTLLACRRKAAHRLTAVRPRYRRCRTQAAKWSCHYQLEKHRRTYRWRAMARRLNLTGTAEERSTGVTVMKTVKNYRTGALRSEGAHAVSMEVRTCGEDWREHTNMEKYPSSSYSSMCGTLLTTGTVAEWYRR